MLEPNDPKLMTAEECRNELAGILARGMLRRIAVHPQSPSDRKHSNSSQTGLELCPETRLSVAQ